jgi:hypothetical protein
MTSHKSFKKFTTYIKKRSHIFQAFLDEPYLPLFDSRKTLKINKKQQEHEDKNSCRINHGRARVVF